MAMTPTIQRKMNGDKGGQCWTSPIVSNGKLFELPEYLAMLKKVVSSEEETVEGGAVRALKQEIGLDVATQDELGKVSLP